VRGFPTERRKKERNTHNRKDIDETQGREGEKCMRNPASVGGNGALRSVFLKRRSGGTSEWKKLGQALLSL